MTRAGASNRIVLNSRGALPCSKMRVPASNDKTEKTSKITTHPNALLMGEMSIVFYIINYMYNIEENKSVGSTNKWMIVLLMALVFILVVWLCGRSNLGGKTSAEVEAELMGRFNTELADPSSDEFLRWKSTVEKLHGTVTVSSLRCTACSIKLREDKEEVHDFCSDVESYSMTFVASWDGWVDKGGSTTIQYDHNLITNAQKCSVLNTTALITVTEEDIKNFMKCFIQGAVQAAIISSL